MKQNLIAPSLKKSSRFCGYIEAFFKIVECKYGQCLFR